MWTNQFPRAVSEEGDPNPGKAAAALQGQHLCPSGGFAEVEGGCAAVFLLGERGAVSAGAPGPYRAAAGGQAAGCWTPGRNGSAGQPRRPSAVSSHVRGFLGTARCPGVPWSVHSTGHGGYQHSLHRPLKLSLTFSNPRVTPPAPTSTASSDSRKLPPSSVQGFLGSVSPRTRPVVTGFDFGGFKGRFYIHPIYPFR